MKYTDRSARLWAAIETKRLSVEDKQTDRMRDALRDAIEPILERLKSQGPQDAIDDLASEINQQAIEDAYISLYQTVGVSFALDTFKGLLPQKQDPETIEDMWMQRLEEFAKTEAGRRIVDVSQFTVDEIRKVLNKGIQEGWGIEKIAREMQSSSAVSRVRARRVARTEIVSASNEGSMIGARATSLNLKKLWIDTPDSRTRPTHVEAGAQEPVDIDEPFRVGGYEADYPGDPSLPASESVNCRCAVAHKKYG